MSRTLVQLAIALSLCLYPAATLAQRTPPRILSLVDVLQGSENREIRWPVGIAGDMEGRVAVADAFRPAVLVFSRVGVSWSLQEILELPEAPVGLARIPDGWVVALSGREGLQVLETANKGDTTIDLPEGTVPGPIAASAGGDLLVYDRAAASVLRLARGGSAPSAIDVEGSVTALADDGSGGFFAALADQGVVLRFDASGRQAAAWELPDNGPVRAWPAGLVSEPGGKLFVSDRHSSRILVLDPTGRWIGVGGREGKDPGLLSYPGALALSSTGDLVVADLGNGRVQILQLTTQNSVQ